MRLATSWVELVSGRPSSPTFKQMAGTETICGRPEVNFELNWQSSRDSQFYDPGTWGGIYDQDPSISAFGDDEARVVCRELGLSGGRRLTSNTPFNFYNPSSGPAWIKFDATSATGCSGSEATLSLCRYEFSNSSFCVGNICPDQMSEHYAQLCCEGGLPLLSSSRTYVDPSSCTACAVGTYKSSIGSSLCEHCPAGKYSNSTGATA